MGGPGSGRKPNPMNVFFPKEKAHRIVPTAKQGSEDLVLPNYSGTKRSLKEGHQSIALEGSVIFSDGKNIAEDNSNFFWDDTNNRLGIGTSSPGGKLHIQDGSAGTITDETWADDLIVENSGSGGISIQTPDANAGRILFQSASQDTVARIDAFYNSGSEYMSFEVADSEAIRIIDGGNVGIGTTAPDGILHTAKASASTNQYFDTYSTNTGHQPMIYLRKSAGTTIGTPAQTAVGEEIGRIDFQGVNTGGNFDQGVRMYAKQDGASTASTVPASFFIETYGASLNSNQFVLNGTSGNVGIGTNNPGSRLTVAKVAQTNEVNLSDTLFVNSTSGRVGIGTSSPSRKLEVLDETTSSVISVKSTASHSFIQLNRNQTSDDSYINFMTDDVGDWIIGTGRQGTASNLSFQYYDGSWNTAMFMDKTGNVGIGTTSPNAKLQVVGDSHFGEDTTNYAEFESDGFLQFHGTSTAWDDQQINLGNVRFGASAPTWTAYKGSEILEFNKAQDNKIFFTVQLSHKYKLGTNLHFHVHMSPEDDVVQGVCRWILTYSWADINSDFPAETTTTTDQTVTANTADKHTYFEIDGAVSSASGESGVSGILLCSLTREGTHANDTLDSDVFLHQADFHMEVDTIGSDAEGTK